MEVYLPLQKSISCRTFFGGGTQLKISPLLGFSPNGNLSLFSISYGWQKSHKANRITHPFTATADFSRRRQRKSSTPKSKDSTSRGFMPRTQLPTSTQRKDAKNNEEKEAPGTSPTNEFEGSSVKTVETEIGTDDKKVANFSKVPEVEESENESNSIDIKATSISGPLSDHKMSHYDEKRTLPKEVDHVMEPKDAERFTKSEEKETSTGDNDVPEFERVVGGKQRYTKHDEALWHESIKKEESREVKSIHMVGKDALDETDSRINKNKTISNIGQQAESTRIIDDTSNSQFVKPEAVKEDNVSISDDGKIRDSFLALKLKREEDLRKEEINKLAEKNFKEGNKLFCYPEVAIPDKEIEIFFNTNLSTLKDEPVVCIMGAYNDWKWKSFNINLNKRHLNGDWWSCQVHVPEEAYRIDFVFHNGNDLYDNNDEKDFHITVDGGMNVFDFENFLLEKKRLEQEEFARQKAEREKDEEGKRRTEADRAAKEADRAQAREEVAKRMSALKEFMKRAVTSVNNVWYIEPSEFKGGDKVRLYYNKSSGPLSEATEIWVHGGHNGWKDGLSIFSKLIKSKNKDGDWCYTEFVLPVRSVVLDWVFADGSPQRATIFGFLLMVHL